MNALAMQDRQHNLVLKNKPLLVTPEDLKEMMIMFSGVRLTDSNGMNMACKKSINTRFINIVDPTFTKNNLGKSISKLQYSRIKNGFKIQHRKIVQMYSNCKSNGTHLFRELVAMFKMTFETNKVHPLLQPLLP